jgi:hypothetical protein
VVQFRYDLDDRYDTAFVEVWSNSQLFSKLTFNRPLLETHIAELQELQASLGNKAYVHPQNGLSLSPEELQAHIIALNKLHVLLGCTPYINRKTGVNLEKPPTSSASGGHREAGPARGGPQSDGSSGSAWQGVGSGPGGSSQGGSGGGYGP